MGGLAQHFRYAFRRLRNDKGFACVAVFTLALGIGANSAMFSVVNAVLLRPLPYRDPQRLVLLAEHWPQFPRLSVSYLNFRDWRDQSHSFEAVGAVRNTLMTMTGSAEAERIPSQNVTANLFDLLGVKPEMGRAFTAADDTAGAPAVALLGHSLWQRKFSSSPAVIGQTINLDHRSYSIVGVMPAKFEILEQTADVLVPLEPWARTLPDDRNWHPGILPIARLKPGVTVEQARSEIAVIAKRLTEQYPDTDAHVSSLVDPVQEQMVGNARPALMVLISAVGVVLLIACANVANLLLVRAAGRRREMAVRSALGARRGDIVRQLVAESLLVAVAGGAVGLLLTWVSMPLLVRLAGTSLPRSNSVAVDGSVLGFTALAALIAGILFGLAPARHAWQVDLRQALSETNRGGSSSGVLRTRSVLVVAEIALAMLLLVGAGLLFKSFERLSSVSPGFSTDHLMVADSMRSPDAYPDAHARLDFYDRLFEQIAALPGVKAVGGVSSLPVTGRGQSLHFNIQGRPPKSSGEYITAGYRVASAGYLKALGAPLLAGRWIEDRDGDGAPTVVVVNSSFVRTYFPNESPLGKFMQVGAIPEADVPWMQIVGIVGDVKQSLGNDSSTEMYVPYRQADKVLPVAALSIVVRTAGDPLAQANAIRSLVHEIDPTQPITGVRTMEENVSRSMTEPRFRTVLLTIFAGIALVLASVGIFGVMAYSVSQRTRELGLRMALGASRADVLLMVLAQGLRLTLAGVGIGLAATFFLTRYVASMLFNVPPYDPLTLAGVVLALMVISLCACYLPARRATLVDPIEALREQ
ncbi:MAG: ABC transporter permease [Terracidiphilus sp.]|jgi:putative ABC transport system permease protein